MLPNIFLRGNLRIFLIVRLLQNIVLRGDRGGEKEGKTESSPLEEAQAGPVATDDVRMTRG